MRNFIFEDKKLPIIQRLLSAGAFLCDSHKLFDVTSIECVRLSTRLSRDWRMIFSGNPKQRVSLKFVLAH